MLQVIGGLRMSILRNGKGTAIRSGMTPFVERGYKFFRKRYYVLNYFVYETTAEVSEGINNKIKR